MFDLSCQALFISSFLSLRKLSFPLYAINDAKSTQKTADGSSAFVINLCI